MKKKAIIILLFLPFIIALFAFITTTYLIRDVEQDITDIQFDYEANQYFDLSDGRVELKAEAVYNEKYPVSAGNDLVWSITGESDVASISSSGSTYYLNLLKQGQCQVTCSNEKGNVSKSFMANIIGSAGGVIINATPNFTMQGIDQERYVGLYDLSYSDLVKDQYQKVNSELQLSIEVYPEEVSLDDLVVETSSNVKFNAVDQTVKLLSSGESYVKFSRPGTAMPEVSYNFTVIDGVNVYSYDDLLMATNFSTEGESVVQRVNFESYQNAYDSNGSLRRQDTVLFGHHGSNIKQNTFSSEVYRFETTYNHDFLDAYNAEAPASGNPTFSTDIIAGLHIQKDYYGNGFVVNLHDLTYPYNELEQDGNLIATLDKANLFRGPLVFYSLGIPYTEPEYADEAPLMTLFGQDNIGFYVEGDDITLNDVHFKNADFGNNYTNLQYTGTVLELDGNNITLKNSQIQNGRNVVRNYSGKNNLIENCLLSNGMEFLLRYGSNQGQEIDLSAQIDYSIGGKDYSMSKEEFLAPSDIMNLTKDYKADTLLSFGVCEKNQALDFLAGYGFNPNFSYTEEELIESTEILQKAFMNTDGFINENGSTNYAGDITVKDTFFYHSGIASIFLDSYPQGSYNEFNITSLLRLVIGIYITSFTKGNTLSMYPTKLNLVGDNRFYDWKQESAISFASMLAQNISSLFSHIGFAGQPTVSEEDYFPLKAQLVEQTSIWKDDNGSKYVNLPIMKMGGGYNSSDVYIDGVKYEEASSELKDSLVNTKINSYVYALKQEVEHYSDPGNFLGDPEAIEDTVFLVMQRAACNILGFNDYEFISLDPTEGLYFNQYPSLDDLKGRV